MASVKFPSVRWHEKIVTFRPRRTWRGLQSVYAVLLFAFFGDRVVLSDIEGRGWSVPSGHLQEGETPEQAIRREAQEEAGIVLSKLEPLGVYLLQEADGTRWYAPVFIGEVAHFMAIPDSSESQGVLLIPPEDVQEVYHLWDPLIAQVFQYALEQYRERFPPACRCVSCTSSSPACNPCPKTIPIAVGHDKEVCMFISQRAQRTSPSPTLAITAKARKMREEGIDVLSFGAGEPDFDTPEFIKEAAVTALREGFTKYTPTAGIEPLRKAICDKLWRDNGLKYEPNQIIVTCGGKHALYNAFQVICDPGDEVIIPAPYWVSYPEMVKLADGVPVFVYADESTGFVPTIDAIREKISARTRAIVVNSPCNPTGAVFHRQRLKEIAALALRHDLYIVSDEIYEKMVYDGHEHVSIASLGEEVKKRTILVNGMSKAYSMTGWRIGYAAAERELIAAMTRIQDQSTSNPTSIAQKAALAALQAPEDTVKRMVAAFAERRRAIVDGLNRIPGFRCAEPGGAFYAFPNVSALYGKRWGDRVINNSDAFAEYLLEVARVAVVPGSGFGADENIRLSYACSLDTIRNGLARIADAVQALQE